MTRRRLLWIGSYTPDSGIAGSAAGLQRVWFDPDTAVMRKAELAAPTSGPSFVVHSADQTMVYAVNELDSGRVTAFAVSNTQQLTEVGSAATAALSRATCCTTQQDGT